MDGREDEGAKKEPFQWGSLRVRERVKEGVPSEEGGGRAAGCEGPRK